MIFYKWNALVSLNKVNTENFKLFYIGSVVLCCFIFSFLLCIFFSHGDMRLYLFHSIFCVISFSFLLIAIIQQPIITSDFEWFFFFFHTTSMKRKKCDTEKWILELIGIDYWNRKHLKFSSISLVGYSNVLISLPHFFFPSIDKSS